MADLGCNGKHAKWIILFINLVFGLIGIVLLGFGIFLVVDTKSLHNKYFIPIGFSADQMIIAAGIILAVGVTIVLVRIIGCCATVKEHTGCLIFYSFLLVVIMAVEILLASQSSTVAEKLSRKMSLSMEFQLVNEYNRTALPANRTSPETYKVTTAWDTLQLDMNCCGVHGPEDYLRSAWFNESDATEGVFVPPSCSGIKNKDETWSKPLEENYCQVEAILFPKILNESYFLNTEGCHPVVTQWIHGYSSHAFFFLTVLISTQIIDLILACFLMYWVRKKHRISGGEKQNTGVHSLRSQPPSASPLPS